MNESTSPIETLLSNAQAWTNDNIPYVYGGSPSSANGWAADCSSYVNALFAEMGYSVGGYTGSGHGPATTTQVNLGERIYSGSGPSSAALANAQPGDLLFFTVAGEGTNAHVGVYAGNGMMYNDPETGQNVDEVAVPNTAGMYVDDVQRYINAQGQPLGSGITYTGQDVAGPSGTSSSNSSFVGTGSNVPSSGSSSTSAPTSTSSGLLNKSMLVRVGIGLVAAVIVLIGIDKLSGDKTKVQLPAGSNVPPARGAGAAEEGGAAADAGEAADAAVLA